MTSALRDSGSTRRWRELRAAWSLRLPAPCSRCGELVLATDAWHLDHTIPRSAGGSDRDARPAHARCNMSAGPSFLSEHGDPDRHLSGALSLRIDPDPPELDPMLWRSVPWLADLLTIPPDATWPRLMSAPHPRAVGSYGPELVVWSREELRVELRWWQQLSLARLLEYDADGELVWLTWIVSTPRQVGKSWLLRVILSWRIHQAIRFGEPQLVLHTGKDLNVCHEVQRPARAWARARGYKVREANGQQEIEATEGSRWMIRGRDSLYGYSASLAAVDEAWHVPAETVEDGLEPTMAERRSPQLGLVSTAHRAATPLVPGRRTQAIAELASPVDTLLLEWSALPDAELGSVDDWRRASPYWSARRERLVADKHARAMAATVSDDPDEPDPREAFRSQYLNVWPSRYAPAGRDEPLVDELAWRAARDLHAVPIGPLTLALDDYYGQGAAVAAAGKLPDGRLLVYGREAARRGAAIEWLAQLASTHAGSTLIVNPTLASDPELQTVDAKLVEPTQIQTRAGLAQLRQLLGEGRLAHDGGDDLTAQLARVRVRPTATGLQLTRGRADLVRAACWALLDASTARPAPRFAIY